MRNAHIAVYAFMSVCSLSGLSYVFYSAFGGDVLRATAVALFTIGGVTAGFLALAAVRLGTTILNRTALIEELVVRIDALEQAIESNDGLVDVADSEGADPHRLVAADVSRDAYPRLVADETCTQPAEEPAVAESATACSREEHQWQMAYQNGDLVACQRTLKHLRGALEPGRIAALEAGLEAMSRAKAQQFREDFARLVRSGNYNAALIAGERIVEVFPDSDMAREFEALRPHLTKKTKNRKPNAQPASVG